MKDRIDYRLDMFNQSTAPKRRVKISPELVPKKRLTRQQIEKNENDERFIFSLKAILTGTVIFTGIAIMIYSKVLLNEKVVALHGAKNTLDQLGSENTRLNNEVEHKVSYSYITEYAENTLGMVKMNSQQIHYINESTGDRVEMYQPADEEIGFIEKIIGTSGKEEPSASLEITKEKSESESSQETTDEDTKVQSSEESSVD